MLGPQEIKGERGLLVGYVTMNTRDRDEVSVVEDAERLLQAALRDGRLTLPAGYYWEWSGQFENQVRATKRMQILIPVCLAIMFVMLYLGFQRWWMNPPDAATISTTIFGLMPIFWSTGRGSDIMQPMAIPSVGGMIVSILVTIYIAPCLFCAVEEWKWKRAQRNLTREN